MKLSAALAGLLALSLLAGCSSAPSVIGTWTGKSNIAGSEADIELNFDAAGKMVQTTKVTAQGQSITLKTNATYKSDKEKLDVTIGSIDIIDAPAMFKQVMEKATAESKGQTVKVPYKIEGDTMSYGPVEGASIPGGSTPMTFTRKK